VLIDDRVPPDQGRQPVDVNWRLVGWLAAAAVLVFAGVHATGFVAYLILCATVYAVCKALVSVGTYEFGLREWRQ
jgi:hypothetical protein